MTTDLHGISQAAADLVIGSEVSNRTEYERRYAHPTVPGVNSGVTVGIGYDLGQSSKAQIEADWSGKVDAEVVSLLVSCAGLKGAAAKAQNAKIKARVSISWDAAMAVFSSHDIPRYLDMCKARLPGFDGLHPDCRGALWSLVFNRGASFDNKGPRYVEMRAIKVAMQSGDLASIPGQFRAMKRLWAGDPQAKGLLTRRDNEADLFENGLRAGHPDDHALVAHRPAPVDADVVARVQTQLRALGYVQAGTADGTMGKKTKGAILAFRHDHDLPLTPTIDDAFLSALASAPPMEHDDHRVNATADDVRQEGSKTLDVTDQAKAMAGKMFGSGAGLSVTGLAGAVASQAGAIKGAKDSIMDLGISHEMLLVGGCMLVGLVVLAVAGGIVWFVADKVEKVRVADYRSGKNT